MTMRGGEGRYFSSPRSGAPDIVWTEPNARRVRVFFADVVIADSNDVLYLFEGRKIPVYYFPRSDVRTELLQPVAGANDPRRGESEQYALVVGERRSEPAAWRHPEPIPDGPDLSDYVAFFWDAVDAWFEEDDQVFRHARDPYKRVDVLHSSRHLRVLVDGDVVADSVRPKLLFETGLPVRYYLPKLDVRMDLLVPTTTRSRCPYKGEAVYWTLETKRQRLEDVVWSYPAPVPEMAKIENLLAFYNDRVDIEIDGVPAR